MLVCELIARLQQFEPLAKVIINEDLTIDKLARYKHVRDAYITTRFLTTEEKENL